MRILLVETGYKNKYPPMGLMKISTYHKSKGDYVVFVKGKDKKLAEQMWDRIYITTLFTFNYKITVDTVRFYKSSVFTTDDIYIGGILASLMTEDLKKDTGIDNVLVGQLTSSRIIGFDEDVNVDVMPLDYDMLDDVDYKYPAGDNYFAYTTRGCPNKCSFCAVPKLEPEFKTVNHIIQQITYINENFGEKQNLLLLDNNILKSPDLRKIVDDMKTMGFYKGATYKRPNIFPVLLRKANKNIDDERYLKRLIKYLLDYKSMMTHPKTKAEYLLFAEEIVESENPLKVINAKQEDIQVWLERYKDKRPKLRYVDFNQGIDARLMTPENMAILSELPLNPIRIAFDKLSDKDKYIRAVDIAYNCGIKEMSNYNLSFDEATQKYSCETEKQSKYNEILMLIGEAFLLRKEKKYCINDELSKIISTKIYGFSNQKELILKDERIPGLIAMINDYKGLEVPPTEDLNQDDTDQSRGTGNDQNDDPPDDGDGNSHNGDTPEDENDITEDKYIPPVKYKPKKTKREYLSFTIDEAVNLKISGDSDFEVKTRSLMYDLSSFSVYEHPYACALLYRTLLEISTRLVYYRHASAISSPYNGKDLVGNMKYLNNNFLFTAKSGKDIPKLKEAIKVNLSNFDIIQILNLYIHYSNPVDEQILLSTWNSMKFYIQACLEK